MSIRRVLVCVVRITPTISVSAAITGLAAFTTEPTDPIYHTRVYCCVFVWVFALGLSLVVSARDRPRLLAWLGPILMIGALLGWRYAEPQLFRSPLYRRVSAEIRKHYPIEPVADYLRRLGVENLPYDEGYTNTTFIDCRVYHAPDFWIVVMFNPVTGRLDTDWASNRMIFGDSSTREERMARYWDSFYKSRDERAKRWEERLRKQSPP